MKKKIYIYNENYINLYFRDEGLRLVLKQKFMYSFKYTRRVFFYCIGI